MNDFNVANEEEQLLHSVLLSPGDNTPRILLADYYEALGDPRGEMIRIGLELWEKYPVGTPRPLGSEEAYKRWRVLRERQTELIASWGYGWCDGLLGPDWKTIGEEKYHDSIKVVYWSLSRDSGYPFTFYFRRGFISEVHCTQNTFLAHAGSIFRKCPIEKVVLTDKTPELMRAGYGVVWNLGRSEHGTIVDCLDERIFVALEALSNAYVLYGRREALLESA